MIHVSHIEIVNITLGFVFIFVCMQFIVALINVFIAEKLPDVWNQDDLISILVPVRNEEKNIATFVKTVEQQEYKNYELLICDDSSTDSTLRIARALSDVNSRIRVIESGIVPPKWMGKNYACYRLSQHAQGRFFLFLDADVRVEGSVIGRSLSYVKANKIRLLSIFPNQQTVTLGEKFTVPVIYQVLLSLLPLILVRFSSFVSLSAANGQFMLFDAETYKNVEPHWQVKSNCVEDIAISRLFKKKKLHIACLTGEKMVTCRMYDNYSDAVNGFSRNISAMFGNSIFLAILFWLLSTVGVLFFVIWMNSFYSMLLLVLMFLTNILIAIKIGQRISDTILYYIPQRISLGLFIYKHIVYKLLGGQTWKGRSV